MTTTFLAPDPIQSTQFIPGGNTPANGGQLFFYQAGTSTKQTVYKDNLASVSWTNPIVLDSGGNLPNGGEVWFSQGIAYKVVFAPSNDTDPPASPYWSKDNLSGINDVTASSISDWTADSTPTFVSATSFTLSGDQTAKYTKGRRVKTTNTAGTVYSTVLSSAFGAGVTTVVVASDTGTQLDSGLSAVSYGLVNPAASSINDLDIFKKANTTVAASATTDIWGVAGDYVHITSSNATIFSFSTAPYAGARRELTFDGNVTIATSATLIIPSGFNLPIVSSDSLVIRAESTISSKVVGGMLSYLLSPNIKSLTTYSTVTTGGIFTTGGSTYAIWARMVGGGGGGGAGSSTANLPAAGGGGGAGSYAEWFGAVNPNSTYTYSIGAQGAAGSGVGNGGNGGNTSLTVGAVTVIAPGGTGGSGVGPGGGGSGGAGGNNTSSASYGVAGTAGIDGYAIASAWAMRAINGFGGISGFGAKSYGRGGFGGQQEGAGSTPGSPGSTGAIVIIELGGVHS